MQLILGMDQMIEMMSERQVECSLGLSDTLNPNSLMSVYIYLIALEIIFQGETYQVLLNVLV